MHSQASLQELMFCCKHGHNIQLLQACTVMSGAPQSVGSLKSSVPLQFEDPTDRLQSLRDLVDLQRAMYCGWLQSAAQQVTLTAGALCTSRYASALLASSHSTVQQR